jgi:hypothetical protein
MEQPKRAGSPLVPLAHKRVSVPKKEWASGGPQQQTAMQREGGTAKGAAGVQRNAAKQQARNAASGAALAVERDSRVSLRRVAALVALIAIGLSPAGAGVSIVLDVVPTRDKGAGKAGEGLGLISDTEVAKHFRPMR